MAEFRYERDPMYVVWVGHVMMGQIYKNDGEWLARKADEDVWYGGFKRRGDAARRLLDD